MHDRSPVHAGLDRGAAATLLLLCACWGLGQVAVKVANAGISPGMQAGLRSLGAAALVLLWARAQRVPLFRRDGTLAAGLAAGLLFAVEFLLRASAEKTLFYQLAVSAVALPLGALALGEPGVVALTPLVVASLLYQTIIVAFASYVAWFWLVARYPPSRLAAFSFLTPVFGVAFGGLLLGEQVSAALIAALALVAGGIYLVNRPQR